MTRVSYNVVISPKLMNCCDRRALCHGRDPRHHYVKVEVQGRFIHLQEIDR